MGKCGFNIQSDPLCFRARHVYINYHSSKSNCINGNCPLSKLALPFPFIKLPITYMKKHIPHMQQALVLTPAIFLMVFWILAMSSSGLIAAMGLFKLIMLALLLSFGVSLSITMFISNMLKQHNKNE